MFTGLHIRLHPLLDYTLCIFASFQILEKLKKIHLSELMNVIFENRDSFTISKAVPAHDSKNILNMRLANS